MMTFCCLPMTIFEPKWSSSLDGSVLPYKNLRKELKVLLKIKHPSILSCVGFTLKPSPTLIIEYAPEGSLETILENSETSDTFPLTSELKFKIIFQVAEVKILTISWKTGILGNRISSRVEHYLSRFEIRKCFDFLARSCSASGGQDSRLWYCRAFDSDGNAWLFWNCWLFCSRSRENTTESKSRDNRLRKKGWCV